PVEIEERECGQAGLPARSAGGELPQDVLQDAAVPVVLALLRRVDAQARLERLRGSTLGSCRDRHLAGIPLAESRDVEYLAAGEPERRHVLTGQELQRCDAHA